jgi:hypothetical protein
MSHFYDFKSSPLSSRTLDDVLNNLVLSRLYRSYARATTVSCQREYVASGYRGTEQGAGRD